MNVIKLDNQLPYEGQVYFNSNFMQKKMANQYFDSLNKNINWQSRKIKMFGKLILQPRLMCWMGDPQASYKYSGVRFDPVPWNKKVLEIKKVIESQLNFQFNSVLLNLYRDNNDSMGAHSDNEKELGSQPMIASMSLGGERKFIFKHKLKKQKVELSLCSGSLLIMKGDTQEFWKHELPKVRSWVPPRINLTFRKIVIAQ